MSKRTLSMGIAAGLALALLLGAVRLGGTNGPSSTALGPTSVWLEDGLVTIGAPIVNGSMTGGSKVATVTVENAGPDALSAVKLRVQDDPAGPWYTFYGEAGAEWATATAAVDFISSSGLSTIAIGESGQFHWHVRGYAWEIAAESVGTSGVTCYVSAN